MLATLRDLLRTNWEFACGSVLLVLVLALAAASFFSPYSPLDVYVVAPDMPPGADYWLGTTSRGQDLFWQLSAALRNTLTFGIIVAAISRVIALLVGMFAGYLGGVGDRILMIVNDTFVILPIFPILVLCYFVLRDQLNWALLAIITGCLGWAYDARLIRAVALSVKTREFTTHSVFSGMGPGQIVLREHLPYVAPILFSTTMNNLNWSIGLEVTLSVLGFTDINRPSIGGMIYWANQHTAMVSGVWWWIAFPVIAVIMLFVSLFLLAISMNEYIDPRSRLARLGAGG